MSHNINGIRIKCQLTPVPNMTVSIGQRHRKAAHPTSEAVPWGENAGTIKNQPCTQLMKNWPPYATVNVASKHALPAIILTEASGHGILRALDSEKEPHNGTSTISERCLIHTHPRRHHALLSCRDEVTHCQNDFARRRVWTVGEFQHNESFKP